MPSSPPTLRLRPPTPADVPTLYLLQSDPESNRMAGTKPRTREAFFAAWERIFTNPNVNSRIIEVINESGAPEIAGSINVFQAPRENSPGGGGGRTTPAHSTTLPPDELQDCFGYWIARPHWNRGVASRAVALFLAHEEPRRPLHATAARANTASTRILEKCGFRCTNHRMAEETDRYTACEISEFILD